MNTFETTQIASPSLSEVHRSVRIPQKLGFFRKLLSFAGPAYLVSVGYMDPGNWATDLEGGARFGYQLIWVLLMSNLMAVLLQTLSARMGIVAGRDLAQACRENYPKPIAYTLWFLCEIAIAACDLAEVLGTAIGLNLLFGIPLLYGVVLTAVDTILFLIIQSYGIRKMEALILALVSTIGICFALEMVLAEPMWSEVMTGFVPKLTSESLYVAIGILGATVMPHNLYLHSALVQTRAVDVTVEGKRQACKFNLFDTAIALNAAFFVNAAILVLSASVFFKNGVVVTEIKQAHELLTPLLGTTLASTLFAVALLAAGQSSTLTGTLAGQIVMEGFLHIRIRPWLRRLITRMIAIVPAVIVIGAKGEHGSYDLLILSQVILSLQLPFAIIPLIQFTSDRAKMGVFTSKAWVKILAWVSAAIIVGLNARLVADTLFGWIDEAGESAIWLWVTVVPLVGAVFLLLVYISLPKSWRMRRKELMKEIPVHDLTPTTYRRIGVAIDHSEADGRVLAHASTLAQQHRAEVFLFHVVEGVSVQLFGKDAADLEARSDVGFIHAMARQLSETGLKVNPVLGYGRPARELVRLSELHAVDILVMGGHRHQGLRDLVFGTSINKVRHRLKVPVLVV
ncbi:MAG: Nramp family divalent metal transporter [Ignavibacteriales bacterium]|nr:Nramp family divalent metal transporter [Ignavibacteriales bacterium]